MHWYEYLVILVIVFVGVYGTERFMNWLEDRKTSALPVLWDDPPHWITWDDDKQYASIVCEACGTAFGTGDQVLVFPQEQRDVLYGAECVVDQ